MYTCDRPEDQERREEKRREEAVEASRCFCQTRIWKLPNTSGRWVDPAPDLKPDLGRSAHPGAASERAARFTATLRQYATWVMQVLRRLTMYTRTGTCRET